ncbi:16S rRNA (cytidine(1402)-2'-O)-methyltransferase [Polynucleobacter sp. IMCC30063]|uniref:16S rRNA (cytidine(1402)-2'-O)-methyltransferase n=1 Tax=unclassified Polynucleobacter TaxID=2640945 RepID=UPI001F3CF68B|nr:MULTISPECIES: 16S rRNA (cytidine(1402)-2'-O)-methyltransferase [unclassified Polynucleobacter]MCE7504911.1 16S rRNA (cytidine(1402)-2'-O)-methyltransferase [Polynucleobacter sp. IMCC30063]MCE7526299.1 16S rRNA (cytidine(1402)-2'-O)-methyltransferase [Polynucleobacter sp. IMCC 30228]MCE7528604.1 16S rRNA (cytidine(1402)-2'-O)-methyltransferase [Polynucleobacter sp. IMCC 29146]
MELGIADFLQQQDLPASALYVVATPIGNLGDITLRALHVLNAVDGIACEDTRHSAALLRAFGIHKKCVALHEHNEVAATKKMISHLKQSQRWAYISDAGTPGISDPGAKLVGAVQQAGFRVIPIPGPSALTAIASVGGGALDHLQGRFQFIGFLPHKVKERERVLNEINLSAQASIFLESPHQIQSSLLNLSAILKPEREIIIGRELTKKFEAIAFLTAGALKDWLANAISLKGEFIILVAGEKSSEPQSADAVAVHRWINVLAEYLGSKEIAKVVSTATGMPQKAAYQLALMAKKH